MGNSDSKKISEDNKPTTWEPHIQNSKFCLVGMNGIGKTRFVNPLNSELLLRLIFS